MDWLRDCYSAPCRFHDDPAAPLSTVTWYFTDLPFQEHESAINSKHWLDAGERTTLVGEQWIYPPKIQPNIAPVGLTGGHECGQLSDFQDGQPWPYTGPPVVYDEDGIPTCCPRYYGLTVTGKPSAEVTSGPLPPYGDSCCDAPLATLGTTYSQSIPATGPTSQQWYRYVLSPGTYTITTTSPAGANLKFNISEGATCGPPQNFIGQINGGDTFTFTLSEAVLCVEAGLAIFTGSTTYTMKVS